MSEVIALAWLYRTVTDAFESPSGVTKHAFGWRAANENHGSDAIVWAPGDPNGALGELGTARKPGRDPRPIANLHELFTVEITAVDESAPEDALRQYVAARLLFDAWWRAVYATAYGTVNVVSARWKNDRRTRPLGATIEVVATIDAMIPDCAPDVARAVVTSASVDIADLDVTDTVTAP